MLTNLNLPKLLGALYNEEDPSNLNEILKA